MSKKVMIITSFLIVLVIVGVAAAYLGLHGNPFKKKEAGQKIEAYLVHDKGYNIEKVEGTYSFTSSNAPYGANVVFKDEPNTTYSYIIFKDGHIDQAGYSGNTSKHLIK